MADPISLVVEEIESGLRKSASEAALGSLYNLSDDDARSFGQALAGYLKKYVQAGEHGRVEDATEVIVERFRLELAAMLAESPEIETEFLSVGAQEFTPSCRTAAAQVLAPILWSHAVGNRWHTAQVCRYLGVSRQAIHKRVVAGSLLGLPGEQTTWFPTWQFDLRRPEIRPESRAIVSAFRDHLGPDVDPFVIAAWATTAQHEDLDGLTPAQWLDKTENGCEQLERAARRAAARLAQ